MLACNELRKSELAVLPTTKQLSRPAGAVAHQLAFNEYVVAANTCTYPETVTGVERTALLVFTDLAEHGRFQINTVTRLFTSWEQVESLFTRLIIIIDRRGPMSESV